MPKLVTFIEKEFILNQVKKNASRIVVFGSGKSIDGTLKSFDKETLILSATAKAADSFKPWDPVSVFLSYQSQRVTFPGKVKKICGGELVIGLPENLIKAPQRKAVRVPPPKDLKLEFLLQNERIRIDCPESGEYSELQMPALSVGFDTGTIHSLLESFREKTSTMYSKSGIVMFNKGRKPETVEERLISDIGRTLLVPSTHSPLPSADPYPEGRIITQAMAEAFEGPSVFLEGSALERSRAEKTASGVVSELYCPILYYQYVVGYIYLMNDETRKTCLDYRAVDFSWEFSRILAYSLKANNYFRLDEEYAPNPYKPQVVDLSAGGCLLLMPKAAFKVKLKNGSVLDIAISRGDTGESVAMKGRVARRFDDKENDYYGVAFMNADQDALVELRKSLYADDSSRFACDEATLEL
ncbi:MAG: PilZ domain-containing protein [Spirochaetes bacterium]|nr:PilZ domain-containing protein [Spirochaetota bacterium]MBU1081525.1 PilZ domain-containing protein [Spirochaetota bacterium]